MIKYTPEEIYHICNCLLQQIELDYYGKDWAMKKKDEVGLSPSLTTLIHIIQYLNKCPCEQCREHIKELEYWLKEIRNPKSFWRINEK